MLKKLFSVLTIFSVLLTLGACNTVRGIGQDIEKGGEALQRAANK